MIHLSQPTFLGNEEEYVGRVLQTGNLSMGAFVAGFESILAEKAASAYAIATSSGTSALHLALLSLGLKHGQRVIVPACSYIATANAVRYCGGVPIFIDVNPHTWTADEENIVRAVQDLRAVGAIVVHLYGAVAPVPRMKNAWVVEDSCEAHGLPLRGDAAVFSFYGNKIVTCGEGGAVVTNDSGLASKIRLLRGQGTTGLRRYIHEALGFNYRLTDLQAALGLAQMEKLEEHLAGRAALRAVYDSSLPVIQKQQRPEGSVDWVMPVRVWNRNAVGVRLQKAGIETRPAFPPLHIQPIYRPSKSGLRLPHAESLGNEGLLLPLHLGMSVKEVQAVCSAFQAAQREGEEHERAV